MIISLLNDTDIVLDFSVVALKGNDVAPSIISLIYIEYFGSDTKSSLLKMGVNSFATYSASAAPIRNEINVPTLPKMAALIFRPLLVFSPTTEARDLLTRSNA